MLTLYGRETSINVQKVAWALGELGLQFDWIDREGQIGSVDVEDYEKLNPARRIPTLVDNGLILNQSNSQTIKCQLGGLVVSQWAPALRMVNDVSMDNVRLNGHVLGDGVKTL